MRYVTAAFGGVLFVLIVSVLWAGHESGPALLCVMLAGFFAAKGPRRPRAADAAIPSYLSPPILRGPLGAKHHERA